MLCQATILVVALLLPFSGAEGHKGNKIIAVIEVTDDALEGIDLKDGTTNEWEDSFEPSVTLLDFIGATSRDGISVGSIYDPFDLDFRAWVGWNATNSRIYVSVQAVDDSYVAWEEGIVVSDQVSFFIDGDHSGGEYFFPREGDEHLQQAQLYAAFPMLPDDPAVNLAPAARTDWPDQPPYADAGGGHVGEAPVVWVIEFYVTPFDKLIWDDQEESVASVLEAGKVIGVDFRLHDVDEIGERDSYVLNKGEGGTGGPGAGFFADGLLMHADSNAPMETTAVRALSWGRIKASLSMEEP